MAMARPTDRRHYARMNKRLAAAMLWFLAAWYLGAWVALLLGVSALLGPILGIAAAVLFAGDPLGIIWVRREAQASVVGLEPESRPEDLARAA